MGVIETLQSAKRISVWQEVDASTDHHVRYGKKKKKKSNLGFVNFNSYSMLRTVTKVLVILNLHSTCKAYMIEKIMVEVIWWKRLKCVC